MKVKELKENIRDIIRKKMDEANALVTTKTGTKPVDYKNATELNKLKSDPNVSSIETTAGQKLKEMDFTDDDDDIIIEDVEDIDDKDPTFKDYDNIYEINANVAPGSRYQIEVSKGGKYGNLIVLTQDNGQEIVVHPDDVKDLVKVILEKYNEAN
jgi:hypothetical protein